LSDRSRICRNLHLSRPKHCDAVDRAMNFKLICSIVAILLTMAAYFPYIYSIINRKIKPHTFSWIIWGSTTIIVFLAQLKDGGGLGAWPIGVSGAITILVAYLSYIHRSDSSIKKIDWIFFLIAMASLPVWYFTSNPFWAVVLLTTIDLLGFGPTIRKSYEYPFEENMTFFLIFVLRNIFATIALEHYSFTTVLFPATTGTACMLLCTMVVYRRYATSPKNVSR
jgi:hypothetical protein